MHHLSLLSRVFRKVSWFSFFSRTRHCQIRSWYAIQSVGPTASISSLIRCISRPLLLASPKLLFSVRPLAFSPRLIKSKPEHANDTSSHPKFSLYCHCIDAMVGTYFILPLSGWVNLKSELENLPHLG